MNTMHFTSLAMMLVLSACGGSAPDTPAMAFPEPSKDYVDLNAMSGTVDMAGVILTGGTGVAATSGEIDLGTQIVTGSNIPADQSIDDRSTFAIDGFTFSRDVELDAGRVAIIGAATAPEDLRTTGEAAYSGQFVGQLVDVSQTSATTLNWDADVQVSFAGNGDVDMTFRGGGSALIDQIEVTDAQISDGAFAGGTLTTSKDGTVNNVTGTDLDLSGAFFGYNRALQLPSELGGALVTNDSDTDISGAFIASAQP